MVYPALGRFGHRIQDRINRFSLSRGKAPENPIGQIIILTRSGSDPDPDPSVVLAPQSRLDTAKPVVSARTTLAAKSESPRFKSGVVHNHQKIMSVIKTGGTKFPNDLTAAVHPGQRLDQSYRCSTEIG